MPAEPSAYCWAGIYHPGLPELCTTDLRRYKMFCREDRPTVGMIFTEMSGYGEIYSIRMRLFANVKGRA